ncbi:MAG: glutamate formimidoyltransferase [Bacteroidota bacterium]
MSKSPTSLKHQPRLLECIPNISEGQYENIIQEVAKAVKAVSGVQLLHVDVGASANRTVFTFIGIPEAVVEAAFQLIKRTSELIDMRNHQGEHPRMGATDVCPLVPYRGVSLEEAVGFSKELGQRVGDELGIPVYLYEASASQPHRKNLAHIRSGEYEGFREKILHEDWKPDYGPAQFHPKAGQTVIGARDFLVAYNMNLNTTSVPIAKAIAAEIRESGKIKRIHGKKVLDAEGKAVRIPGKCKSLKAIGWYMEEFGIAQVSTNLTNLRETSLEQAFEAASASAIRHGVKITGSELVGLLPLTAMLQAGTYYEQQQSGPSNPSETELISLAIRRLGLDDLKPFDPRERIIEYQMR